MRPSLLSRARPALGRPQRPASACRLQRHRLDQRQQNTRPARCRIHAMGLSQPSHRPRPHSPSAHPQHRALDRASSSGQQRNSADTQRHPGRPRRHTARSSAGQPRRQHIHSPTNRAEGTAMTAPRTLFEKVWNHHIVAEPKGEPTILYIDLHLVHEVTSPQAFDGLRMAGRKIRRPDRHIATVDHNVPTTSAQDRLHIVDQVSAAQVNALRTNCAEFGVEFFDVQDASQGIVHMIGPELGATKPGMTIVCGDSHTSTHGAFGALAFGIGTSEVEHVMATQTLPQSKPNTFRITVDGELPFGVTAKDIILDIIGRIGTDGATGYAVEYAGSAIRALSMEGRMTICNMSIEAGARAGMIAPDETTFVYLQGRRFSPRGAAWEDAVEYWRTLRTDDGARFDRELTIDAT